MIVFSELTPKKPVEKIEKEVVESKPKKEEEVKEEVKDEVISKSSEVEIN